MAVGAVISAASASSYQEFGRGLWSFNHGDYRAAIAYFDKALAAGDLAVNLSFVAHMDSGASYAQIKNYPAAIEQYSAAIALNPADAQIYRARADSYLNLGNTDSALADMDAAVARAPHLDSFLFVRGRLKWGMGRFSEAADDFAQAVRVAAGTRPYYVLWLEIARRRTGTANQTTIEDDVSELNVRGWPMPILRLYVGRDTPDEVIKDANDASDAKVRANQTCEADFYIGEYYLWLQKPDAAKPLFTSAADTCPDDFIEKPAAQAERDRLSNGAIQ